MKGISKFTIGDEVSEICLNFLRPCPKGGRGMHVHTYTRGGGVLASSISFGITIVRWPIPCRIYKPEPDLV